MQAYTPPSSWYIEDKVWEYEKQTVFARNWVVSFCDFTSEDNFRSRTCDNQQDSTLSFRSLCWDLSQEANTCDGFYSAGNWAHRKAAE